MATKTQLPILSADEVSSHNTSKSCYVTMGNRVYDMTDFLDSHPGGGELILEYGGRDVTAILKDELSHTHSDAAYEIMDENVVGQLGTPSSTSDPSTGAGAVLRNGKPVYAATGMSSEDDLNVDTDVAADYKAHKFLDLDKPLLMQVWRGGFTRDFYLEQVHRPRHYKGGASAPLFGNFLEPLSLTPWWVVPSLWWPPVAYLTWHASRNLEGGATQTAACFALGIAIWTLVEYALHRFVFHVEAWLPDNRVGITLHFLLHGIHHYLPMDKLRLVMPPALLVVLAAPFWKIAHLIFPNNWYVALAVYCGGIFGYTCYDMTHYFLHHRNLPAYYRELKKYHLQHHFADYDNGFGVTSRFWDWVFGTELSMPQVVKTK